VESPVRKSDRVLGQDLREAGLPALAERAEASEWNDYFSPHYFPQHELIAALRAEITLANVVRKTLIGNVVRGKYDATREEADEWAASPEGQDVFGQILHHVRRPDRNRDEER
jgi:hypothetical protein